MSVHHYLCQLCRKWMLFLAESVCVFLFLCTKSRKLLLGYWCNLVEICPMVNARSDWKLVAFDLGLWIESYFRIFLIHVLYLLNGFTYQLCFRRGDTPSEYLGRDSVSVSWVQGQGHIVKYCVSPCKLIFIVELTCLWKNYLIWLHSVLYCRHLWWLWYQELNMNTSFTKEVNSQITAVNLSNFTDFQNSFITLWTCFYHCAVLCHFSSP